MNALDKIEKIITKHSKLTEKVNKLFTENGRAKIKVFLDKALEEALDEAIKAGVKAVKGAQ